jgi:hypothetical protein
LEYAAGLTLSWFESIPDLKGRCLEKRALRKNSIAQTIIGAYRTEGKNDSTPGADVAKAVLQTEG